MSWVRDSGTTRWLALTTAVVGSAALFGGLGACADALSITPPEGAGGNNATTSASTGGEGGGVAVPCVSNADCPFPTTVCDSVRGVCVGCLEITDCAHMPNTVCSLGACVCAVEGESWCDPNECVDLTTDPDNCGQCGKTCFGPCAEGTCVDAWESITTTDAPVARGMHVSEWTGTHLFVWGGSTTTNVNNNLNTGGLYDPVTLEWTPTSLVGAPAPRQGATSVWTGEHVIVWGGRDGGTFYNDGALFDPVTNSWTALTMAAAPEERVHHTAVWTGSTMIVWGGANSVGEQINSGGIYTVANDTWSATAAVPNPSATRENHSAVWAGTEMWIYGGFGDSVPAAITNDYFPVGVVPGGLRYDPGANVWNPLPLTGQPSARENHTAVFDGTYAIVFGGFNGTLDSNLGYRVDSGAIQWEALGGTAPAARREHTAVWLPDAGVMVVWGGRTTPTGVLASGDIYSSSSNQWTAMTTTALSARDRHTAVSTGDRMIVWGGFDSGNSPLGDGGIYTP